MPGKAHVAQLPRQRRPRSARPLGQLPLAGPVEDHALVVQAQPRDVEDSEGAAGEVRARRGGARGGALVPLLVQLLTEIALLALVEQVGDEQLVDDEQEDDEAPGDQELAHGAATEGHRDARPWPGCAWATELPGSAGSADTAGLTFLLDGRSRRRRFAGRADGVSPARVGPDAPGPEPRPSEAGLRSRIVESLTRPRRLRGDGPRQPGSGRRLRGRRWPGPDVRAGVGQRGGAGGGDGHGQRR